MSDHVYVGLEGTGAATKCVVLDFDGNKLVEVEGEGSNWKTGIPKAKVHQNLWDTIDKALSAANKTRSQISSIVACMECVDKDRDKEVVSKWLCEGIPTTTENTTTTTTTTTTGGNCVVVVYPQAAGSLASGLGGSLDGVVLVSASTVMVALGFSDMGEEIRAGGLLRDQGSAFSIGTNSLAAAVRSSDGRGPQTRLLPSLVSHLGLEDEDDLVEWANADQSANVISGLCSICFECDEAGDGVAREIIVDAAKHLTGVVELVVAKSGRGDSEGGCAVVLDGSVACHPRMKTKLVELLSVTLPNVKCVVPEMSPAHGAAMVALKSGGNKHHEILDKIIQDTNDQIPRLNQAIKSIDKMVEEVELQALIASAEIRLNIDAHVIALERRMMHLMSELTKAKQSQLNALNQHRRTLRKLVCEASASSAYLSQAAPNVSPSDIANISEFADEQLEKMKAAKRVAAELEVDGLHFYDDKAALKAIARIGVLQRDGEDPPAEPSGSKQNHQNHHISANGNPTTPTPTPPTATTTDVATPHKGPFGQHHKTLSAGKQIKHTDSSSLISPPATPPTTLQKPSAISNGDSHHDHTPTQINAHPPSLPLSRVTLNPRTAKPIQRQSQTVKIIPSVAKVGGTARTSSKKDFANGASATDPTTTTSSSSTNDHNHEHNHNHDHQTTTTSSHSHSHSQHPQRSRVVAAPRDYARITGVVREFGKEGSGDGCFNGPCCLDVSPTSGLIFVADRDNHRIQVFTLEGAFVRQFGSKGVGSGQFSQPQGVVVTRDSHVVVADKNNHRVQIFTEDGSFVRMFGSEGRARGQFQGPVGVATDPNNSDIFVADCLNHRVQVFTFAGDFKCEFGSQGSRVGQFMFPLGIAVGPDGRVVVVDSTNHRVQILSAKGSHIATLKPTTTGGQSVAANASQKDVLSHACAFQFPVDVAVDGFGNIVVTDKENVQVFASDSSFVVGLKPGGSGNGLRCVAVSRESSLIVLADNGRNRIQVI